MNYINVVRFGVLLYGTTTWWTQEWKVEKEMTKDNSLPVQITL